MPRGRRDRNALTAERLRAILHYDPESGAWTWLDCPRKDIKAGTPAGHRHKSTGYIYIFADGVEFSAHNLAHLYMTGSWPDHLIDHKDTDRENNRWDNLRPATHSQNATNRFQQSRNTTGVVGVYLDKRSQKWFAEITANKTKRRLGRFASKDEAIMARQAAEAEMFGEFRRAV